MQERLVRRHPTKEPDSWGFIAEPRTFRAVGTIAS